MATGFKLRDGRLLNVDQIVLVTVPEITPGSAAFTIEFSSSKTIVVRGSGDEVRREHDDLRRAMGIPDKNMIR